MAEAISRLRLTADPGNPAQTFLCVVLGSTFTLGLFMGMAHFGKTSAASPAPEVDDLRVVALPIEPPPPPQEMQAESTPVSEISTVTGFDLAPSDSPVKIAVSPPSIDDLSPTIQLAPPAIIQIGELHGDFKPRVGLTTDIQHIYQKSEVDTIPVVLFRAQPPITEHHFGDLSMLRLTLLFVVEADGTITNVRVSKPSANPVVDAIVMETFQSGWGFSPAIKKGRKVRCMLEQPFLIPRPHHSPFKT
jgi:TonB family protein